MIEIKNISKSFNKRKLIDNFNLKIANGDFICITGESGTGKTTLLNIIGLLEKPDEGDIIINDIKNPNKKQILLMQRNLFGYLFQNYALIENETVEKNLSISLEYQKNVDKQKEINKALQAVNLEGYNKKKIFELSGGEQQRVALARIISKNCEFIFADEPTGNLDKKNRDIVFDILKKLNGQGKTIIFVTHDQELAKQSKTVINL